MKDEHPFNPVLVKKELAASPAFIEEILPALPIEQVEEVSKLEFIELPISHNPPIGQKYQDCLARLEWENSKGAAKRMREIENALPPKNSEFQAKYKSVAWNLSRGDKTDGLANSEELSQQKDATEQHFSIDSSLNEDSSCVNSDENSSLVFLELPVSHEPPSGMTKEEIAEWTKWNTPLLAGSLAKQKEAQAALKAAEKTQEALLIDQVVEEIKGSPMEAQTRIEMEEQLQELFQKFEQEQGKKGAAQHDRLMVYLCQMVVLLARLFGRQERENILDLNDKLQENIIQQKETYATAWPTALKITGFVISAGAAALGVAPLGGAELFGQATKKLAEASQAVSGFGNGVNSLSDLFEQYQIKDRTLFSFEGKHAETLRGERDRGSNQTDQNKAEALRAMQAVVSSLHEIANKILQ